MKKYVAISIVVMFLSSCGDYKPGPGSYNYEYHIMPMETLAQVERNPAAYTGTLLAFEGDVLQAEEVSDGVVFQILAGNRYEENRSSLTVLFPHKGTTIARGYTVKVLGYPFAKKISGTNAFGGIVSSVAFDGIAVCGWYEGNGGCWYANGKEDIYHRWASGELFSSK